MPLNQPTSRCAELARRFGIVVVRDRPISLTIRAVIHPVEQHVHKLLAVLARLITLFAHSVEHFADAIRSILEPGEIDSGDYVLFRERVGLLRIVHELPQMQAATNHAMHHKQKSA